MNRKDLFFVVVAVAVIGLFIFLSVIGKKPAAMTPRAEHVGMSKDTPRETCLQCHAPGSQVAPMDKSGHHPKKGRPPDQMSCFACHKPPEAAAVSAGTPRTLKKDDRRLASLRLIYLEDKLWPSQQER
jgi:hypothetical protein